MAAIPDCALMEEMRRMALASGALLVGFADVKGLAEMPRAVVVAMKHSPEVFADADDMPAPPTRGNTRTLMPG